MKRRLFLLIGTLIAMALVTALVVSVATAAPNKGKHLGPPAKIT